MIHPLSPLQLTEVEKAKMNVVCSRLKETPRWFYAIGAVPPLAVLVSISVVIILFLGQT